MFIGLERIGPEAQLNLSLDFYKHNRKFLLAVSPDEGGNGFKIYLEGKLIASETLAEPPKEDKA